MNRVVLLLALTACLIIGSQVPGLHELLYPVRLMVTYVHEGCHGLAALLTGGLELPWKRYEFYIDMHLVPCFEWGQRQ